MSFELFVEVTRDGVVESRHFGAAAVCDFQGNILHSWGDIDQLIFVRSAIKPMLAIDVIQSGAADHYELSQSELALACASIRARIFIKELSKIGWPAWVNPLTI